MHHSRIRWLTVILITVLVPINCWWIAATLFNGGVSPTQVSLYFNAIFSILVLTLINQLFGLRQRNQPVFNRIELLTIYTCISVGSSLAGVDRMMVMVSLIGHAIGSQLPKMTGLIYSTTTPQLGYLSAISMSWKTIIRDFRLFTNDLIYLLGCLSLSGGAYYCLPFTWWCCASIPFCENNGLSQNGSVIL